MKTVTACPVWGHERTKSDDLPCPLDLDERTSVDVTGWSVQYAADRHDRRSCVATYLARRNLGSASHDRGDAEIALMASRELMPAPKLSVPGAGLACPLCSLRANRLAEPI